MSSGKVHALSSSAGLGIKFSPCARDSCELESDAATCNSTTNDSICSLVNVEPKFRESPSFLLTSDLFHVSGTLVERPSTCSGDTNPLRASVVASDCDRSEINTVLGDAKSRLKSGVKLLSQNSGEERGLCLEKTKRRSRVDVDVFLDSNIAVEGGYLQGLIKVHVRKHKKKGQKIMVSGGKVMAIGFESDPKQGERSIFYQNSAMLSDVASDLDTLYSSDPDPEGFFISIQGDHWLPFSLSLSSSSALGRPLGCLQTRSGLSVRYIVMVFLRIKNSASGKKSIAHMYRECGIWPRLNPSVVLAPVPRPIQVTVSEHSPSGKVRLTASLHRLHWVAGQLCHVCLEVVNDSKKTIKNVTLGLVQFTNTFKHSAEVQSEGGTHKNARPSATQKLIAQSNLVAGESSKKGHASAKGWWLGVTAGASQSLFHSILLPSESLSIRRGQLLEVSYTIRITIGTGTLFSTDINASLPLEIINFLSIDPPPDPIPKPDVRPSKCGTVVDEDSTDIESEYGGSSDEDEILGNSSAPRALTDDEIVQRTVSSARVDAMYAENAPKFADLYFSSLEQNAEPSHEQFQGNMKDTFPDINEKKGSEAGTILTGPRGQHASKFAVRVETKNQIRKASVLGGPESLASRKPVIDMSESNPPSESDHQCSSITPSREGVAHSSEPMPSDVAVDQSSSRQVEQCEPVLVFGGPTTYAQERPILSSAKDSSTLSTTAREISALSSGDIIDAYTQPTDLPASRLPNPQLLETGSSYTDSGELRMKSKAASTTHSSPGVSTAAPPGSVRDKIRELEELAAKANVDK